MLALVMACVGNDVRDTLSPVDTLCSHSSCPANPNSQEQIAELSRTVINLLNARQFSNPWFLQHVSNDVRVDVQGIVAFGMDSFLGNYTVHAFGSPGFHCIIGNITTLVDENQCTGTAILSQYLSQYQSDERRMAGTVLMSWKWDWNKERWICRSVTMMIGTPVFLSNDIYRIA